MDKKIKSIIEALLFVVDKPLKSKEIIRIIGEDVALTETKITTMIKQLNVEYASTNKPYYIKNVAGGYRFYVKDEFFPYLEELVAEKRKSKLTPKALETLAIIAYKQPITKSEMESIRGVNVDGVVRTLMERNLIMVSGRAQAPGKPLLYSTTQNFLEYFGLNSIEDLPKLKEIDEILEANNQIKREIGDVILKEIMPEKLGMVTGDDMESESSEPDENKENREEEAGAAVSDGVNGTEQEQPEEPTER